MKFVYFDIESTGVDPRSDRIIELTLIVNSARPSIYVVNPGVPIPAEAAAVHGFTDDAVKDAPPFSQIAPVVQGMIDNAVLVGYNSRAFDTVMLDAELRRAGQRGINLLQVQEIDVFRLWNHYEPRTLENAYRRFTGKSLNNAHESFADVKAMQETLFSMLDYFGKDVKDAINQTENIERFGCFRIEDGEFIFNFGKFKGEPVTDHPGYLEWMLSADFQPETKEIIRGFLALIKKGETTTP